MRTRSSTISRATVRTSSRWCSSLQGYRRTTSPKIQSPLLLLQSPLLLLQSPLLLLQSSTPESNSPGSFYASEFPRTLRTGNRVSEKTSSRKVSEQRLSPLRNCKACLQASRLPPYFSRPCVVREQGAKLWDAEGITGSGTTGAKRSRSGEA